MAETTRIGHHDAGDAPEIARLFYEAARTVNQADCSDEQVARRGRVGGESARDKTYP